MVDINLMGEEERHEERQREESFAKTVSLDARELQNQEKPYAFDKRTVRQVNDSSRKLIYGLLVAIILVGIAAIFYFMPTKPAKSPARKPAVTEPAATAEPPATTETPAPTAAPEATTMSPMERSLAQSTHLGAWTIDAVAKSFDRDSRFTLISYFANRRFLVEFVSPNAEMTKTIAAAVQQNVQPTELKVLPPTELPMDGGSLSRVLLSGSVNSDMSGAVRGQIQQMSYAEFIAWLQQVANDHRLRQRSVEARPARDEEGLTRTPVMARFYGPREGMFGFLDSLAAANPAIDIAKIIIVSADRKNFSDEFLELALNFEFVQLL